MRWSRDRPASTPSWGKDGPASVVTSSRPLPKPDPSAPAGIPEDGVPTSPEVFAARGIDGATLVMLEDEDLLALGITER